VPYLTPDELPEERDCRALSIPATTDWLAIVSGALTELTKSWNWEQQGAVTVAEAVAAMQAMIDEYYEGCNDCILPGGFPPIRINISGKVEIFDGGEWVVPTSGDYYIPPPEAREGGTPDDQICLAAKNAVNVLHQLYTNLSDSFGEALDEAAAGVLFVEAIAGIVGVVVASISAGILALGLFAFQLLYQALSYLTDDLWNEDFESQITCFLVDCATNDAGVVTFDWECFNDKLNSLADDFSLTELQIRLYLQIGFILQFIGGADGLNLAGATTEITDDDCEFCSDEWCREWDQSAFEGEWTFDFGSSNGNWYVDAHINFGVGTVAVVGGCYDYTVTGGDEVGNAAHWYNEDYSVGLDTDPLCTPIGTSFLNTPQSLAGIAINPVKGSNSGIITVTRVKLWGTGTPPDVGTAGCDAGCDDLCL